MNKVLLFTIIILLLIMGWLILLASKSPINFRSKNSLKPAITQNDGENHAGSRIDGYSKKAETQKDL